MPLYMDMHSIDGGVAVDDVAQAHVADLKTQDRHGVRYLRYWVNERHVDGFRFDLASALARELYDVDMLSGLTLFADLTRPQLERQPSHAQPLRLRDCCRPQQSSAVWADCPGQPQPRGWDGTASLGPVHPARFLCLLVCPCDCCSCNRPYQTY